MRARILYEILQIGNLIARPRFVGWRYYEGNNASVRVVYAWWYRPVVALVFWIAGL